MRVRATAAARFPTERGSPAGNLASKTCTASRIYLIVNCNCGFLVGIRISPDRQDQGLRTGRNTVGYNCIYLEQAPNLIEQWAGVDYLSRLAANCKGHRRDWRNDRID